MAFKFNFKFCQRTRVLYETFIRYTFRTNGEPNEEDKPEEIQWREDTEGKLDLLVSLDFRMTATPLYSDIVLPFCNMV